MVSRKSTLTMKGISDLLFTYFSRFVMFRVFLASLPVFYGDSICFGNNCLECRKQKCAFMPDWLIALRKKWLKYVKRLAVILEFGKFQQSIAAPKAVHFYGFPQFSKCFVFLKNMFSLTYKHVASKVVQKCRKEPKSGSFFLKYSLWERHDHGRAVFWVCFW